MKLQTFTPYDLSDDAPTADELVGINPAQVTKVEQNNGGTKTPSTVIHLADGKQVLVAGTVQQVVSALNA